MAAYYAGVDVGGTRIKMGLFSDKGELLEKWEIPTNTEDNGDHILSEIVDSIEERRAIHGGNIKGIGVGIPGPITDEGVVLKCANFGWGVFNVKNAVADLTGVGNVRVSNDANVAALGEMWKGGGQGHKNLVAVTLGTGVGGGIIINGEIMTGATGAGGEIGHIHVEDNETEPCGCGNLGCLEEYASATGITRLANRALRASDKDSALRTGEVSAKAVFDAVKAGDELAIEIAKQFGDYLGKGLGVIAGIINPEIFVIGGGVSKAGEVLFEYIKPSFEKTTFSGCKDVIFALATLGNDAGIYGAARLLL